MRRCSVTTRGARRWARRIGQPRPAGSSPTLRRSKESLGARLGQTDRHRPDDLGASRAGEPRFTSAEAGAGPGRAQAAVIPVAPGRTGIQQAVRRLFHGETLPASAKVVSLFEAHTQILHQGKAPPSDTEFGHKVNHAEVEAGRISDWQLVAQGNPPHEQLLPALLRHHQKRD